MDDLKSAYLEFKGDMDQIMDNVMCATIDDEERFRDILNGLIQDKVLTNYTKFSKEKANKSKTRQRKVCTCIDKLFTWGIISIIIFLGQYFVQ